MDLLSLAQSYGPFVVAMAFAGVVGGLLAGLLGVGGGIVIVPVLFSTLGTLGISDDLAIKAPDRPPFSIGYVNLIAFMALVPLTTLCAPLGARLAHALPGHILSYAFAVFLLLTSARMLWSVWAN